MGCFRKKMGPILTSKTKKSLATFTVKIRKKLKLNTELQMMLGFLKHILQNQQEKSKRKAQF